MLKIIILPAALISLLAVYAMVEELVERRLGRRLSPQALDKARARVAAIKKKWVAEQLAINERHEKAEAKINEAIDAKFNSPLNRVRLWLAWKITP